MTTVTIPSQVSHTLAVMDAIIDLATRQGYSQDTCFAIRLAMDEALANAIRHGNQGDPQKQVQIQYNVSAAQIKISVCDQGGGFCPDDVPDPTLDENLYKPHGRGLMLIHAYLTQAYFNKQGNCITLIKNKNCNRPIKK